MRLCACGCGQSIDQLRSGAKWATPACAERWARAHPGQSRNDAHSPHVVPTPGLAPTHSHGVRRIDGEWTVIEWPPAIVIMAARTRELARQFANELREAA